MSGDMTEVLRETLEHVKAFVNRLGYSPTVRELAKDAGVTETAVLQRLRRLEALGYIKRARKTARSITVVNRE